MSDDNNNATQAPLATEDPADDGPKKLTINVRESDGNVTSFKVKETTKMSKLFSAYAQQRGKAVGSFRLVNVDGKNLQGTETVKAAGLEDNEVLDVFQQQVGGNPYKRTKKDVDDCIFMQRGGFALDTEDEMVTS